MSIINQLAVLFGIFAFFFYLIVSLNLFLQKTSEIKILEIIAISRNSPRNRSQLTEQIVHARQAKKKVLLWPLDLANRLVLNVKKKIKK